MPANFIIADSSPLIALERIGQLELLHSLFERLLVPPAVARKIAPTVTLPSWIEVRDPSPQIRLPAAWPQLGSGESDAICLAVELVDAMLLTDDRQARYYAGQLGFHTMGCLGIAIEAKHRGFLTQARPVIEALIKDGLFVSPTLLATALELAGEAP